MSKPIFEDLFKFSGRRNRKSYILLLLIQSAIYILLIGLVILGVSLIDSSPPIGYLLSLVSTVLWVVGTISIWANGSQRVRDFGYSGVWILATLIPYIGFVLSIAIMFVPSSVGENKYGPSCI